MPCVRQWQIRGATPQCVRRSHGGGRAGAGRGACARWRRRFPCTTPTRPGSGRGSGRQRHRAVGRTSVEPRRKRSARCRRRGNGRKSEARGARGVHRRRKSPRGTSTQTGSGKEPGTCAGRHGEQRRPNLVGTAAGETDRRRHDRRRGLGRWGGPGVQGIRGVRRPVRAALRQGTIQQEAVETETRPTAAP